MESRRRKENSKRERTFHLRKVDLGKVARVVTPLLRSDPIGESEPDPGCSLNCDAPSWGTDTTKLSRPPDPDPTRLANPNRSPGRDTIYTIYWDFH